MRSFELVSSDFWGKEPEKLRHELDEEVLDGFDHVLGDTLEELASNIRNGGTGKHLVTRGRVSGRYVLCKLDISTNMGTAVFIFRAKRTIKENTGAFYAYCLCCVQDSFDGFASCVMGNDHGDYLCEVALKPESARMVLLHLQLESEKAWIETG